MVKNGYEHLDITFSKTNEKEIELFKWIESKAGLISKTAIAKQLLYEAMLKEKDSK